MAAKAEALNNKDWGLTWLSHGINNIRGLSTEQAAKVNALQDAVQHYGQEITKFYAGSPGGEAERNRFLQTISAAKSPQELAVKRAKAPTQILLGLVATRSLSNRYPFGAIRRKHHFLSRLLVHDHCRPR